MISVASSTSDEWYMRSQMVYARRSRWHSSPTTKTPLSPVEFFSQVMSTPKTKSNQLNNLFVCLYQLFVFGGKFRQTIGHHNRCCTMTRYSLISSILVFCFCFQASVT
ncbi:hypothetical protein L6452_01913 [Arctium lappa]|uniref:Uncharacterized protein n=1 Tax=Arctium lappa TaxID=4217 RepID=A0ACB9FHE4_ARCLA|nr:hypothetical protein L6452_01913 [Arctium lappa]